MEIKRYNVRGNTIKELIEFLDQFDENAEIVGEGVPLEFWKFEYSEDGKKQLYLEL